MKIKLRDTLTNKFIDAHIVSANKNDMPLKKDGWSFKWKDLHKEGGIFYKVILSNSLEEIQGIMKLSIKNDEMVYMENVEVAPHNFGAKGRYDNVAGCLFAYCYKQSMILGKRGYEGFVVFDSKTVLIDFYKRLAAMKI